MKRLAFISFLIITGCSSTPPIPEEQDFLLQSDQIAQIEKKIKQLFTHALKLYVHKALVYESTIVT